MANMTTNKIKDDVFKNGAKKSVTDFTRKRTMPFEELVLFLLFSLKSSTQSSLRRFFASIGVVATMKQQSLSEGRQKIKVSAFVELFRLSEEVMTQNCTKKWHNYRIYAIDGSKISLPTDKKLLKYYGGLGKDKTAPTAQGSALYDVLNDIVADAAIEPMYVDERTLAKGHIKALKNIAKGDKKLLISDRGYPSFEMIEEHENNGLFYLMRVKRRFNADIDKQTESDGYIWLTQGDKRLHVRVIKFMLDSGEEETLITNITDKRLGKRAFKKLYFMRWPVEIKYDVIKNKVQLENFNTRTICGIQQDFFAAMYLTNFAASCAIDVQETIEETRKCKQNKYEYKANMNEVIGVLKDRLVLALTKDDSDEQAALIHSILKEISSYVVPVRQNRSVPRNNSPRNSKFHHNQKPNC
jgi:hypothetical protein